jgi:hypothetical protein
MKNRNDMPSHPLAARRQEFFSWLTAESVERQTMQLQVVISVEVVAARERR